MNNFKKIGLTALAASLVSTSVFAGEMAVTGSAKINFENYSMDKTAESKAAGTKAFSMGNQLTFKGSGELDNGLTVALSFVLDQGDNETFIPLSNSPEPVNVSWFPIENALVPVALAPAVVSAE